MGGLGDRPARLYIQERTGREGPVGGDGEFVILRAQMEIVESEGELCRMCWPTKLL